MLRRFSVLSQFHSIGFRQYPNISAITTRANRFWLGGAVCGVLQDAYKLRQNAVAIERVSRGEPPKEGKREMDSLVV